MKVRTARDSFAHSPFRAVAVVNSWKEHQVPPGQLPPRDFVKLNRKAAVDGCTSPTHVKEFRQ